MSNEANQLIAELLIKKYDKEMIKGLLNDEYHIELTIDKDRKLHSYREYRECPDVDLFDDASPESCIMAIHDAQNMTSYSNWLNHRMDILEEVLIRFCKENKIPIEPPEQID